MQRKRIALVLDVDPARVRERAREQVRGAFDVEHDLGQARASVRRRVIADDVLHLRVLEPRRHVGLAAARDHGARIELHTLTNSSPVRLRMSHRWAKPRSARACRRIEREQHTQARVAVPVPRRSRGRAAAAWGGSSTRGWESNHCEAGGASAPHILPCAYPFRSQRRHISPPDWGARGEDGLRFQRKIVISLQVGCSRGSSHALSCASCWLRLLRRRLRGAVRVSAGDSAGAIRADRGRRLDGERAYLRANRGPRRSGGLADDADADGARRGGRDATRAPRRCRRQRWSAGHARCQCRRDRCAGNEVRRRRRSEPQPCGGQDDLHTPGADPVRGRSVLLLEPGRERAACETAQRDFCTQKVYLDAISQSASSGFDAARAASAFRHFRADGRGVRHDDREVRGVERGLARDAARHARPARAARQASRSTTRRQQPHSPRAPRARRSRACPRTR